MAIDVSFRLNRVTFNVKSQPELTGSVAKADIILIVGNAVGNNMQIEPRWIPRELVLEVVGIALGLDFQNGERCK